MAEPIDISCLVVDDEPLALSLLSDYIGSTDGLRLTAALSNPLEALRLADQQLVHLIFLDVQMPELTGIQFMKVLQKKIPIVLTTAYGEYALEGFEHNVVDYLLKPISFERFLIAVEKARQRIGSFQTAPLVATPVDYFFVKSEYKIIKLNFSDVVYLEGLRDYVAIHTTDNKILTLQSLNSFQESLPANRFVRVHKSYIINLDKLSVIEQRTVKVTHAVIPIGSAYEAAFKKLIFDLR